MRCVCVCVYGTKATISVRMSIICTHTHTLEKVKLNSYSYSWKLTYPSTSISLSIYLSELNMLQKQRKEKHKQCGSILFVHGFRRCCLTFIVSFWLTIFFCCCIFLFIENPHGNRRTAHLHGGRERESEWKKKNRSDKPSQAKKKKRRLNTRRESVENGHASNYVNPNIFWTNRETHTHTPSHHPNGASPKLQILRRLQYFKTDTTHIDQGRTKEKTHW